MEYKTADYHVHSTISPDAKGTMEEMCNAAIAAGIEEKRSHLQTTMSFTQAE